MGSSWHVDDLEIVGYAEVLKTTMLPSVVPPVFRLRSDSGRALVPPYSFNAGFLCNATEVPSAEIEALSQAREITLFDAPIPARPGYELWVDQSFVWHYEPREVADKTLNGIASDCIEKAVAALKRGDFEAAERLAAVAISANDRRVEPLAIKAAICKMQGNGAGADLMAELAAPVLEEGLFALLVTDYCRLFQEPAQCITHSVPRRPMHRVAELRQAAAAG